MLTPPAISADTIKAQVAECYGQRIRDVAFLPIGADVNTAVYRIEAEDGALSFLKLRRGDFDEMAVAVPAFLHAQGIRAVMAPLPTSAQRLWASGHGYAWILYPFFEGRDGYEATLSAAQWVALGQAFKAVHTAVLPAALSQRLPREAYSPCWRDAVLALDLQVEAGRYDDPVAERLAAFWRAQRDEIRLIVARADELGQALRRRAGAFVLCHADLHPGNVLVGARGELSIVDWDNPHIAPKERDLMCLGGGISTVWSAASDEALFYQGYGHAEIDPVALSYYRYERIVADLAAFGVEIFEAQGSAEDRENGLRFFLSYFRPNEGVAVAHATYQRLA